MVFDEFCGFCVLVRGSKDRWDEKGLPYARLPFFSSPCLSSWIFLMRGSGVV